MEVAPELVFDTFTKPELIRMWWTNQTSFYINSCIPIRCRSSYPTVILLPLQPSQNETGCTVTFIQSGKNMADELRALPPGSTSASEEGWQQGFDLMAAE